MKRRAGERIARLGLAARGVFYTVLAILALQVGLGRHGEDASGQGAIEAVARQPLGTALLVILAGGFAAFAAWMLVKAMRGDGWGERISDLVRGVTWAGLAWLTVLRITGNDGGGTSEQSVTARVLNWPFGPALVGLVGLVLIGVAVVMAVRSRDPDPDDLMRTEHLDRRVERILHALGRIGMVSRVVIFTLLGAFLIRAAVTHNPKRGVGLDQALGEVARAPYGPWMLGLVAAGLVAYALWSFARSRYERIELD